MFTWYFIFDFVLAGNGMFTCSDWSAARTRQSVNIVIFRTLEMSIKFTYRLHASGGDDSTLAIIASTVYVPRSTTPHVCVATVSCSYRFFTPSRIRMKVWTNQSHVEMPDSIDWHLMRGKVFRFNSLFGPPPSVAVFERIFSIYPCQRNEREMCIVRIRHLCTERIPWTIASTTIQIIRPICGRKNEAKTVGDGGRGS